MLRAFFLDAYDPAALQPDVSNSRPQFLRRGVGVLVAAGALFVIGRRVLDTVGGGVQRSRRGEPTQAITPTDEFHVVSKNFVDPTVDGPSWRLSVAGSTSRELELNYQDVLARQSREITATLQCISNEVGGELIGNAVWTGFPLKDLIEEAGPLPSAKFVVFRSEDGYAESLPLDFALREEHTLAYLMNGESLSDEHGFPRSLVTPGKYGIKNPKWLTQIILMDEEFFGFWQQRGWTREATMNTSPRIDAPTSGIIGTEPAQIHGIAFSGSRGIEKVEVSLDGGSTWRDATLTPPLSSYSWVVWHYDWDEDKSPGRVQLLARATDGTGQIQTAEQRPPPPSGATGYPKVSLIVQELSSPSPS